MGASQQRPPEKRRLGSSRFRGCGDVSGLGVLGFRVMGVGLRGVVGPRVSIEGFRIRLMGREREGSGFRIEGFGA